MKSSDQFVVVLVTAPDRDTSRDLAKAALEAHLAACVNLVPGIESHYWWQGKLDRGKEVLMVFKTRTPCLKALETLVVARHPYDTPEFVVLPIRGGNDRYLAWLADAVRVEPTSRRRCPRARRPAPRHRASP